MPFYFIHVPKPFQDNTTDSLENVIDALYQIKNSWQILVSILGTIVSIAFFNYAGISVTKEISATTRMVLDSVRTVVIWVVSLAIGWQPFQPLQLVIFTYNLICCLELCKIFSFLFNKNRVASSSFCLVCMKYVDFLSNCIDFNSNQKLFFIIQNEYFSYKC